MQDLQTQVITKISRCNFMPKSLTPGVDSSSHHRVDGCNKPSLALQPSATPKQQTACFWKMNLEKQHGIEFIIFSVFFNSCVNYGRAVPILSLVSDTSDRGKFAVTNWCDNELLKWGQVFSPAFTQGKEKDEAGQGIFLLSISKNPWDLKGTLSHRRGWTARELCSQSPASLPASCQWALLGALGEGAGGSLPWKPS